MNRLIISEDKNTPEITLDPESLTFKFWGKSFPENSRKFYQPVLEWLENYSPGAGTRIEIGFYFSYLSSSSVIAVLEVLRRIAVWKKNGAVLTVNWNYDEDDEEIKRIGDDYMKILDLPFNFFPLAVE